MNLKLFVFLFIKMRVILFRFSKVVAVSMATNILFYVSSFCKNKGRNQLKFLPLGIGFYKSEGQRKILHKGNG